MTIVAPALKPFSAVNPFAPLPEQQFLVLINRERRAAGLEDLQLDAPLSRVAASHSRDMIANGFFGHVSPDSGTLSDRLGKAGIIFQAAGENLAMAQNVAEANAALFESPGHRANLLNPEFTHVGIGRVRRADGTLFVTQVFSRPFEPADPKQVEQDLLSEMNSKRVQIGLLPLARDPGLQETARSSSRDTSRTGQFNLPSLEDLLSLHSLPFSSINAQLFKTVSPEEILRNLPFLSPELRSVGLGVSQEQGQAGPGPFAITILLAE